MQEPLRFRSTLKNVFKMFEKQDVTVKLNHGNIEPRLNRIKNRPVIICCRRESFWLAQLDLSCFIYFGLGLDWLGKKKKSLFLNSAFWILNLIKFSILNIFEFKLVSLWFIYVLIFNKHPWFLKSLNEFRDYSIVWVVN